MSDQLKGPKSAQKQNKKRELTFNEVKKRFIAQESKKDDYRALSPAVRQLLLHNQWEKMTPGDVQRLQHSLA
jgi:hypothetical protein